MERLQGQVAVITGAAQGIGKGIARAMALAGARIVLLDLMDSVDVAAKEIESGLGVADRKVTSFRIDVSDARQVIEVFEAIAKAYDRIDILANNVGIVEFCPLHGHIGSRCATGSSTST